MDHDVDPLHRGFDGGVIADVSGDRLDLVTHILVIKGGNVQRSDTLSLGKQIASEVDAQEPRTAGNEIGL